MRGWPPAASRANPAWWCSNAASAWSRCGALAAGGMFFWVELPDSLDAVALLPKAVDAGMAFVPGSPFYCHAPARNTLRLSFVTVAPSLIDQGVATLGRVLRQAPEARP